MFPAPIVLVVEDDEDIRDCVQDLLEGAGYDVIPASNGKQALDYLYAGPPPAVILLDLMMPLVSGWEFMRAVKRDAQLSSIPIVLTTAVGRDRPPGVNVILKKPFRIADLLDAVLLFAGPTQPTATAGPR